MVEFESRILVDFGARLKVCKVFFWWAFLSSCHTKGAAPRYARERGAAAGELFSKANAAGLSAVRVYTAAH
jgi:hypothetical protein